MTYSTPRARLDKKIQIQLTPAMWREIVAAAERDGTTAAAIIRTATRRYLDAHEQERAA